MCDEEGEAIEGEGLAKAKALGTSSEGKGLLGVRFGLCGVLLGFAGRKDAEGCKEANGVFHWSNGLRGFLVQR